MLRYALIGVLMLSSAAAMADGPSYSYIQAAYEEVDIDLGGGIDADGDGLSVGGSVAVGDSWFVFAGYGSSDLESVIDLTVLTIGGGWHTAISPNTDFFAALGFADGEIDVSGFGSEDDSGYSVEAGIRSMMSEELELYGSISQVDFDDFGDGTTFNAGLWYTVSGNLALGLGASFEDDITSYGVGIRLYFDK